MDVIHTQNQLIQTLKGLTHIAFVPTMGISMKATLNSFKKHQKFQEILS
jgi:hypothetical protein